MIKNIEKLIKNNKLVSAYKITEYKKESIELFYVKDKLETNRATNINSFGVVIYRDFDGFRGNSSFEVFPEFSDEDITLLIEKALDRCLLVKNKYYDLPKKSNIKLYESNDELLNMNFKDVALNIAKAISKANHYKDGSINSYEVFVNKNYKRIINSNGVDLNEVSGDIFVEAIPNWVGKDEEVELYTDYVTSSINYDEITYKIDEALNNCQLRSVAKKLPEGLKKCNVILPQEEISGILEFLARQTSYQNVFMKTNILNVNDNVSGDNPDKLNITLKPEIEGGAYKTLFDDDGLILKDFNFIEDGIIKSYHGDNRFGYYLGIDNPTGMYKNAELKPGTMSFDEMKSEPYIYCMYFSSPQLDDYSGYYGGEVRLGLYFDGKECYPVTGFSISGNLNNDFKIFKFSKEIDTYKNYRGPKYLLIKDMNIN